MRAIFGAVQVRLMAKEHLGRYKNTFDCLIKVRMDVCVCVHVCCDAYNTVLKCMVSCC